MGLHRSLRTPLCLLALLVYSCHGGSKQEPQGSLQKPTGSSSSCQVHLNITTRDMKRNWCLNNGDGQTLSDLDEVVSPLVCTFQRPTHSITSRNVSKNASSGLRLVCTAPEAPPSTQKPVMTSPEPSGPERLLLVEGKERLRCAGVVEFYKGNMGGSICYNPDTWNKTLGDRICQTLNCGTFLDLLNTSPEGRPSRNLEGLKHLQIGWKVRDPLGTSWDRVFRKEKNCRENKTISIICTDFQPKVKTRLTGGSSPCKGMVEVHFEGRWKGLCGRKKNWEQICQEQHCGNLIHQESVPQKSFEMSSKLYCSKENLSHCYTFEKGYQYCPGIRIECQDPNIAGPGAGTVMSIILSLVLLAILLVVCGPAAYKKLEKKFRQKKQRQWIGPTGVNQNVSFHRNHTVTIRSQAENSGASTVENEYSQPPRHSRLSAYPALEGALNRSSNPPDNSSDSDYDLHGAQRL